MRGWMRACASKMACQVRFAYVEVDVVALIGRSHIMAQADFHDSEEPAIEYHAVRTVNCIKLLLLDRWSSSATLLTTLSDQQPRIPSWPGAQVYGFGTPPSQPLQHAHFVAFSRDESSLRQERTFHRSPQYFARRVFLRVVSPAPSGNAHRLHAAHAGRSDREQVAGDALYGARRARAERAIRRWPDRFRRGNREIPHASIAGLPKTQHLGSSSEIQRVESGGTPQIRNSGDSDRCLRASDIFEAVVGANRDGVLATGSAPRQTDGKFVALFRRVADSILRHHDDPVAAIDTILSAVDAASRIASNEANRRGFLCTTDLGLQFVDNRWRVVDNEAFAFALGGQCQGWRIRRGIGGDNF